MKNKNEIIFFDDDVAMDLDDLNFNLEHDHAMDSHSHLDDEKKIDTQLKQHYNTLGLTEEEMETLIAIIIAIMLSSITTFSLIVYMLWYFKQ